MTTLSLFILLQMLIVGVVIGKARVSIASLNGPIFVLTGIYFVSAHLLIGAVLAIFYF